MYVFKSLFTYSVNHEDHIRDWHKINQITSNYLIHCLWWLIPWKRHLSLDHERDIYPLTMKGTLFLWLWMRHLSLDYEWDTYPWPWKRQLSFDNEWDTYPLTTKETLIPWLWKGHWSFDYERDTYSLTTKETLIPRLWKRYLLTCHLDTVPKSQQHWKYETESCVFLTAYLPRQPWRSY